MNIDEITMRRIGGHPQPGPAVTEIGQRPTKTCDHDFTFLRNTLLYPDAPKAGNFPVCPTGSKDVFYCRRCLEYREVKR